MTNRFMASACLALATMMLGAYCNWHGAPEQPNQETIRARHFELVDDRGVVVCRLSGANGGLDVVCGTAGRGPKLTVGVDSAGDPQVKFELRPTISMRWKSEGAFHSQMTLERFRGGRWSPSIRVDDYGPNEVKVSFPGADGKAALTFGLNGAMPEPFLRMAQDGLRIAEVDCDSGRQMTLRIGDEIANTSVSIIGFNLKADGTLPEAGPTSRRGSVSIADSRPGLVVDWK